MDAELTDPLGRLSPLYDLGTELTIRPRGGGTGSNIKDSDIAETLANRPDLFGTTKEQIIDDAVNTARGIRAYHGSPHEFEKFDINKIGTGEGAQAYGHGLYFAESEPVAQGYRDRLTDVKTDYRVGNYDIPKWILRKIEDSPDRNDMIDVLKNEFNNRIALHEKDKEISAQPWLADQRISYAKDILAGLEELKKGQKIPHTRGRMYEVNINAHPDHFLNWDKPLSEQPEIVKKLNNAGLLKMDTPEQSVRNRVFEKMNKHGIDENDALNRVYDEVNKEMSSALDAKNDALYDKLLDMDYAIRQWWNTGAISNNSGGLDVNGSAFLHELEKKLHGESKIMGAKNPSAASEALKNAGIKGVKYLDASSRKEGEGSSNFVVFDPNDIEIMRRYARGGDVTLHSINPSKGKRAMGNNAIDNALRMALGGDAEIEMPRSLKELQDWKKTHPSSRKANMDKLFSDRKSGIEGAEPIAMPADLDELLNYLRSQHNYGGRTGFGFGGDSDVAEGSSYTENTDSGGYSGDWGSYGDFGSAKVKDYGDADTVKASIGNDASDEERAINQARLISGAGDSAARQLIDREDVTNIPSPRDFTPTQVWGSMNRQPQLGGVNAEKSLLEQAMDPSNSYGMAYGNLVGKNFTRAGAAGLLGNAMYESGGMDPTAINPKSGATGLFQHLGERKAGLLDAVNAAGLTGQDLKDALEGTEMAQLAYGLNEIATKPEYMKTKMALQTATDPYTAAEVVMKNFERPGAVDEFLSGGARAAYANQIYNNVPSAATIPQMDLADKSGVRASGNASGLGLGNIFGSTDDSIAKLELQGRYTGMDKQQYADQFAGGDLSKVKSRIVDYGNGPRVDYYTRDLGQALIGDAFKGLGDTVSGLFNKTTSTYSGPKGPNMDVVNADIANRNYIESHRYGPYNDMTAEEYRAVYGGKDSNDLIKAAVNAAQPVTPAAPYTTELGKLTQQLPSTTGQTAQEWAIANTGGDLSKVHARVKYVNGAPRLEYYTV